MTIIKKDNGTFDIEENGIIIGGGTMMLAEDEDDFTYLERIDIDEEHRGQGHGTKALYEIKKAYGSYYLTPDNEDAARLYERVADEVIDERYGNWGFAVDNGWGVWEV